MTKSKDRDSNEPDKKPSQQDVPETDTTADPALESPGETKTEGQEAESGAPPDSGDEENGPDPLALLAERDELSDQLLRLRAEFDNYRKRMVRENDRFRKRAAAELIGELLPVLDNLERALHYKDKKSKSLFEGLELVHNQMCELLKQNGLKAIPINGQDFDPLFHEAVAEVESADLPKGRIAEEFQRGYMIGDDVLRPSKVTVSSGPKENSKETQSESEMEV